MSSRSVFCPRRARQAARLMLVVVFPQPPFWLMIAIVRMAKPSLVPSVAAGNVDPPGVGQSVGRGPRLGCGSRRPGPAAVARRQQALGIFIVAVRMETLGLSDARARGRRRRRWCYRLNTLMMFEKS